MIAYRSVPAQQPEARCLARASPFDTLDPTDSPRYRNATMLTNPVVPSHGASIEALIPCVRRLGTWKVTLPVRTLRAFDCQVALGSVCPW